MSCQITHVLLKYHSPIAALSFVLSVQLLCQFISSPSLPRNGFYPREKYDKNMYYS